MHIKGHVDLGALKIVTHEKLKLKMCTHVLSYDAVFSGGTSLTVVGGDEEPDFEDVMEGMEGIMPGM